MRHRARDSLDLDEAIAIAGAAIERLNKSKSQISSWAQQTEIGRLCTNLQILTSCVDELLAAVEREAKERKAGKYPASRWET